MKIKYRFPQMTVPCSVCGFACHFDSIQHKLQPEERNRTKSCQGPMPSARRGDLDYKRDDDDLANAAASEVVVVGLSVELFAYLAFAIIGLT
jgi:hypothetical protein